LLNALQQFSADLAVVSDAIRNSDSAVLKDVFSRAKDLRDAHVSGSK